MPARRRCQASGRTIAKRLHGTHAQDVRGACPRCGCLGDYGVLAARSSPSDDRTSERLADDGEAEVREDRRKAESLSVLCSILSAWNPSLIAEEPSAPGCAREGSLICVGTSRHSFLGAGMLFHHEVGTSASSSTATSEINAVPSLHGCVPRVVGRPSPCREYPRSHLFPKCLPYRPFHLCRLCRRFGRSPGQTWTGKASSGVNFI